MHAAARDACAFMHLWQPPRRAVRGTTFATLTTQGRYLLACSRARFTRRADAFRHAHMLTMEIGHVDSVRFIMAPFIATPTTPDGE